MQTTHRILMAVAMAGFAVATGGAVAQSPGAAPDPADEQAIYTEVLQSWLGGEHETQRVNKRLGPAPAASDEEFAECVKGLHFPATPSDAPQEKILDAAAFHPANVVLIDGATWRATDPEDGMGQGKSVDSSVKEAFSKSLISFSQVAFSADGNDALVSFGMTCGRLCGTGFTIQMHKARGHWKIARRCGQYMS